VSPSPKDVGLKFLKLSDKLDRDHFDCGVPSLNDFLRKNARQNQDKNLSVTTAIVQGDKGQRIVGYHTLSLGTIERDSLPPHTAKKIPQYPVPIIRIGRLAVDSSMKGKGLGQELLMDALRRAKRVHENVPVYAVVVDAIDEKAKEFYLKFGFIPFQDKPLSLFLQIRTILMLFGSNK